MPKTIPGRRLTGLAAALLLAACPAAEREASPNVKMDTANDEWEDGLSASQIESEARALSPEEAEAQGLTVDTTIHLEVPEARDTLLVPRVNEPTPPPIPPGDSVPVQRP